MFIAAYRINGKEHAGVYTRYQDYIRDTFSPDTEIISLIELVTHGRSYQERKECIREQAIEYSNIRSECSLSWLELSLIEGYFRKNGERYHLIEEFEENAIC